ncbi:BTB/POZ domain-containing protein [Aspergillus mulundensis]|uniref:BTB domain-containing protein n=1 Tax=Aspergillus mulundensis TaxID=1810919 RepID=A0A3D8SBQ1_9EURO|nr:hypothetical protein DSM5745_03937 [Aspergillus mulundensis]RDW83611.1 hypothetical protein DSM5745_03937 [Aspergillus mulundensis]
MPEPEPAPESEVEQGVPYLEGPYDEPVAEPAGVPTPETPEDPIPAATEYPAEPASLEEIAEMPTYRIRVSAKHLMLASPYFKKMLTGGWKESLAYQQKGSVEITAEDWDLEALLILLRAIHCQHHLIPESLELETLAKVAVIADYYDCKDVVYAWGRATWMRTLVADLPEESGKTLLTAGITSRGTEQPKRVIDRSVIPVSRG